MILRSSPNRCGAKKPISSRFLAQTALYEICGLRSCFRSTMHRRCRSSRISGSFSSPVIRLIAARSNTKSHTNKSARKNNNPSLLGFPCQTKTPQAWCTCGVFPEIWPLIGASISCADYFRTIQGFFMPGVCSARTEDLKLILTRPATLCRRGSCDPVCSRQAADIPFLAGL